MGYNFLKGSNLLDTADVFYVKYENVAGLSSGAPVTIDGMQVGKVKDIYLANNRGGGVIVEFTIDEDFQFSKESIVKIYSSGFIGGNNLAILPDYTTTVMAKSKDTLQGEIQAGTIDGILERFNPLEKSLLAKLEDMDTVLSNVNQILDAQTKENLRQSISKFNQTMSSFNSSAQKMNTLLAENQDKLNNTFANLDTTTANFAQFSDSLAQIETGKMMRDLQQSIEKFNTIATQIENGEGSVGKLLKDEKLYDNLEGAALQLEQLLEDMKLNPKRYVHFSLFGKRPKPYDPNSENQSKTQQE